MNVIQPDLPALEAQLRRDLEILQYPPPDWVIPHQTPDGQRMLDVVVIGGGMCGLAATFALKRLGVANIRILDASEAGKEGPWVTYARMETLRSPKYLAGPALGMARLTFRSWYEAKFGVRAWERMDKIPRQTWMDYLRWYRDVLNLPVQNRTSVKEICPAAHGLDLYALVGGSLETIATRRVILATGREGMACPRVPNALRPYVGPRFNHSSEEIEFSKMKDCRVAVIGFSASAVDNAAEALKAGASEVHMLVRASKVPRVNKMKSTGYPGFTHGFPMMPPETRLDLLSYVFRCRIAPPRDSTQRVFKHSNARLHLSSEVINVREESGAFVLQTGASDIVVDHVVYCTGFMIDTNAPDETQKFARHIRTFRDSIDNGDGRFLEEFLDFPDLGPAFELRERIRGEAPFLERLHNFTFAATVSHGNVSGDIPCISDGAERLARGIAACLFNEDFPAHLAHLRAHVDPELLGDEIPGNTSWKPPLV